MPKTIWFATCPISRRRFPASYLLGKWRADYSVIDYPVQAGESLGCRGFRVTDYYGWDRIAQLPPDVNEALYVFLRRVENTYGFLQKLGLLSPDDYVRAYGPEDDIAVAYDYGRWFDRD
jgi:hypothetical protein